MTQQQKILDYIDKNEYITSLDATRMNIMDLQGQIQALEKKGYKFRPEWAEGEHYKKYYREYDESQIHNI